MKFELTEKELKKYKQFIKECDLKVVNEQKSRSNTSDLDYDYLTKRTNNWKSPYYGAIGGGYSITFTPNSIHRSVTVTSLLLNISKDITDYDCW